MLSVCYQDALMTSLPVITHLFLPPSKWEWHQHPASNQVLTSSRSTGHKHDWEERTVLLQFFFFLTDSNPSKERAWIELEGIEAIVKTSSKAKFFIEFYSTCLEGMILHSRQLKIINKSNLWVSSFTAETRRSSENDSQGCDVPGFLKLGWSFKQLPKVHSRLVYHGNVSFSFKVTVVSLLWTFVS